MLVSIGNQKSETALHAETTGPEFVHSCQLSICDFSFSVRVIMSDQSMYQKTWYSSLLTVWHHIFFSFQELFFKYRDGFSLGSA